MKKGGKRRDVQLIHWTMADGSRCFICLPETIGWDVLRDHIGRLPGAVITGYLTDEITEVWIDFTYRGHNFTINHPWGEFWFFVSDPGCPEDILIDIAGYCASRTGVPIPPKNQT